jgi:hypothetical protein
MLSRHVARQIFCDAGLGPRTDTSSTKLVPLFCEQSLLLISFASNDDFSFVYRLYCSLSQNGAIGNSLDIKLRE